MTVCAIGDATRQLMNDFDAPELCPTNRKPAQGEAKGKSTPTKSPETQGRQFQSGASRERSTARSAPAARRMKAPKGRGGGGGRPAKGGGGKPPQKKKEDYGWMDDEARRVTLSSGCPPVPWYSWQPLPPLLWR